MDNVAKTSNNTLERRKKCFFKVGRLGGKIEYVHVNDNQSKDVGEGGKMEEKRNRNEGEPVAKIIKKDENEPLVSKWSGEDDTETKPVERNPENTELSGRPRRKTVGPPIRYLLECEDWSHGMTVVSHSRPKAVTVRRKAGRSKKILLQTKEEEVEVLVDDDPDEGGAYEKESSGDLDRKKKTEAGGETSTQDETFHTCQVCGFTFPSWSGHVGHGTQDLFSHACRCHGDNGDGGGVSKDLEDAGIAASSRRGDKKKASPGEFEKGGADWEEQNQVEERSREEVIKVEEFEKPILSAPTRAADWPGCKNRARKNPWCRVNCEITALMTQDTEGRQTVEVKKVEGIKEKKRRNEEMQAEDEEEVTNPPDRPGRRLVRPPRRYLTDSE